MPRKRAKEQPAACLQDLKCIAPEKAESFSPNLHEWLKRIVLKGGRLSSEHVYRVRAGTRLSQLYGAGTLFIGASDPSYPEDRDLFGARLIGVLCNGAKEGVYCFPGALGALDRVDDFWPRYRKVGRCAIDPEHREHFIGPERYAVSGHKRVCKWCGAGQRLRIVKRVVRDEVWEPIPEGVRA